MNAITRQVQLHHQIEAGNAGICTTGVYHGDKALLAMLIEERMQMFALLNDSIHQLKAIKRLVDWNAA